MSETRQTRLSWQEHYSPHSPGPKQYSWTASSVTSVPADLDGDPDPEQSTDRDKIPKSSSEKEATGKDSDYDYNKIFEEDDHGQEFASNSRVYRVYLTEAGRRCSETLASWGESLDVLLIVAAIFSAVMATLVVDASSNLRPDYAEMNAYLQAETNTLLRAIISGQSDPAAVPPSTRSPSDRFVPTSQDVWVNGLWYLGLTLSLTVSVCAGLAKEWIKFLSTYIPGSPQDRARLKEARRQAARFWHVNAIVRALPLLMHGSLFAFLAGLALRLSTNNTIISGIIIMIICLSALFYAVTTILPLIFPHCSYVTPLTLVLYAVWSSTHALYSATIAHCQHIFEACRTNDILGQGGHKNRKAPRWGSISHVQRAIAQQDADLADVNILEHLLTEASLNPTIIPIIFEAISGIGEGFTQLSAIRRIRSSLVENFEFEIKDLATKQQFRRLERYLRTNAVLYTLDTKFPLFPRHPNLARAIFSVAFPFIPQAQLDVYILRQVQQMACGCIRSVESSSNEPSLQLLWIHALLSIMTMGLDGTVFSKTSLVKLHPGTWINIFAYMVDLTWIDLKGHVPHYLVECMECIRKHVSILLPAILNYHFGDPECCSPYFSERKKQGAIGPVTVLELPPGHCRSRLIQFLYAYSKPKIEGHKLNHYIHFPSFMSHIAELWHKTLLQRLHQQQDENRIISTSILGVLRELEGVLQTYNPDHKLLETMDQLSSGRGLYILPRAKSELEEMVGKLMRDHRTPLQERLAAATFTTLMQFVTNSVSLLGLQASASLDITDQDYANTIIAIQQLTLIEALFRANCPRRVSIDRSTTHSPTALNPKDLQDVGKELLQRILHKILNLDDEAAALFLNRLANQYEVNTQRLIPADKQSCPVLGLSRLLGSGNKIFILSDGIQLIFNQLSQEQLGSSTSSLKRAAPLVVIFRATQVVSSFIGGILKLDGPDDQTGRNYLCSAGTLDKCCKIMVWAEFAMYTLNAEGIDNSSLYAHLSKIRLAMRSCLDRWWCDILALTEKYSRSFLGAWQHVFTERTLDPCFPPKRRASRSPSEGRMHIPLPTVALYKKSHYIWLEKIASVLGKDCQDFQLSVYLTSEEYDSLFESKWTEVHKLWAPKTEEGWIYVDFGMVKENVGENLRPEQISGSGLGSLLEPLLGASMTLRSKEIDLAERGEVPSLQANSETLA